MKVQENNFKFIKKLNLKRIFDLPPKNSMLFFGSKYTELGFLSLEDEKNRQTFQIDFQKFSQQMDIVLPDSGARKFIPDLRKLGKIMHGARNMYRDEQLSVAGAGEKVKKLIDWENQLFRKVEAYFSLLNKDK